MKVLKRTAVHEILELKDACRFGATGVSCEMDCGLCVARDKVNELNSLYIKRHELGNLGQRKFFRTLISVLSERGINGKVLAGFDNIENVILFVALEQLREALALHIRGCKLSFAPNLEILLSFYKGCLGCFKPKEVTRFMDTNTNQTSVFNDHKTTLMDFERKHMLHCYVDFTAGFIIGNHSIIKRGWNGKEEETAEILLKQDSIKRKLKHTTFHEEMDIEFTLPVFDPLEKIFFCVEREEKAAEDIRTPLIPTNSNFNRNLIL